MQSVARFGLMAMAFVCLPSFGEGVETVARADSEKKLQNALQKPAPSLGIEEELALMQKQKDHKASYSSSFHSRFFSALTKKERSSKGQVQYQPPRQFRWEVAEPESELYVATGTTLWKYVAKAKHAQKMPMNDAGLEFLQVLLDPVELSKRYELSAWAAQRTAENPPAKISDKENTSALFDQLPADSGSLLFVKLVPKDQNRAESYLYLVADKKTGHVSEIRIAFKNGNRNSISFENWKEASVSQGVFQFEPPSGTAVDKL